MTDGYFSQTEYAKIVQGRNDWNPWSLDQTQAFKDAIVPAKFFGPTLAGTSDSNTIDAKISGEIMQLSAGPLQYAAGYQWSDGNLKTSPSPALFTGDIAGLGGATAPVDQSRTVNAIFGEFAIPVFKSLELQRAGPVRRLRRRRQQVHLQGEPALAAGQAVSGPRVVQHGLPAADAARPLDAADRSARRSSSVTRHRTNAIFRYRRCRAAIRC